MRDTGAHDPAFWSKLAEAEIARTLRALPEVLRARLRELPVLIEDRPGRQLLREGWPDDLLGLFDGPSYGEQVGDVSPNPPTVTLFIENLRAEARDDPAAFRHEVRTTLLHEIGHYLGLDEDGLAERGLE
jgi:predicted Zn-dependent protease with MMP-like domain